MRKRKKKKYKCEEIIAFSLPLSPETDVNGEMLYKLKKKDGGEG